MLSLLPSLARLRTTRFHAFIHDRGKQSPAPSAEEILKLGIKVACGQQQIDGPHVLAAMVDAFPKSRLDNDIGGLPGSDRIPLGSGKEAFAMHRCDHPWCVNPKHLRWGTNAENTADMIAKGRAPWQGWGHPERRAEVEAAMDEAALVLGAGRRKLTDEIVRYVRASPERTLQSLADELGVTNQCVSNIRQRKTWRHIP